MDKASPLNIDMLVEKGEESRDSSGTAWLSAVAPQDDKEKGQEIEAPESKTKKQ